MSRKALIIGILLPLLAFVYFAGLYPVAIVGVSPIWHRTWETLTRAQEYHDAFLGDEREDREETEQRALLFLIEDVLITREGEESISDFGFAYREELERLREQFGPAHEVAYGISPAEYQRLVLGPLARRSILVSEFQKNQQDFSLWLERERVAASISFFFTPFRWTNGMLERVP